MDQNEIVEDVLHAWYTGADNLQPFNGVTNPIITPSPLLRPVLPALSLASQGRTPGTRHPGIKPMAQLKMCTK